MTSEQRAKLTECLVGLAKTASFYASELPTESEQSPELSSDEVTKVAYVLDLNELRGLANGN